MQEGTRAGDRVRSGPGASVQAAGSTNTFGALEVSLPHGGLEPSGLPTLGISQQV